MKSYLDLVPISAKVHRKQNRMSIICIVLAVFLVTAIFGMADMFIRGQILQAQQENGNWHIGIHRLVGSQYTFSDERMGNSNTRGAYYCFGLFIYGFLVLIALITLFNIINSIAMSVVAKMKQYGVFRAIGLSNRQLAKMIIAEASTYAITGTICGSVLGIVCNKILFSKLITYKWGDAWSVPLVQLGIIIVVVAIAVILAVRNPIKKLENLYSGRQKEKLHYQIRGNRKDFLGT